ncbi:gliding motility-associated peptidyl-prolyl isomerase GldI [Gangjinia marincola]|uniref:Peptidyl-prolyl cis-trans isomerase n=1 Tax=Gangjinia marincola TaxID=578463 RepID=A0ABN1MJE9_9FLAO
MKNLMYILLITVGMVACKPQEARRPVSNSSGTFIDQSIDRNIKQVAFEEKLIEDIIAKDTANQYIASKNGFWYYYVAKDMAKSTLPQVGDQLVFDYKVDRLDGTPIYTVDEVSPKSYVMDKEEIFTGLRIGLKLMKTGETVTFLFPSHLGFGYYGDKNKIGTNYPLKTTVSLTTLKKENDSIIN